MWILYNSNLCISPADTVGRNYQNQTVFKLENLYINIISINKFFIAVLTAGCKCFREPMDAPGNGIGEKN